MPKKIFRMKSLLRDIAELEKQESPINNNKTQIEKNTKFLNELSQSFMKFEKIVDNRISSDSDSSLSVQDIKTSKDDLELVNKIYKFHNKKMTKEI